MMARMNAANRTLSSRLRELMEQEERLIGEAWELYLDLPPKDIPLPVSVWLGARHEALEALEASMKITA
jgi:hypothetical protein